MGRGQLSLIDNDILLPQNLGRHKLGFNHIFQFKVLALAEELKRGYPTATVRTLPVDALAANLEDMDLIIEMSIHILAYNMKRVMSIMGSVALMKAMAT